MKSYIKVISILILNLILYIGLATVISGSYNIPFNMASGISSLVVFILFVMPLVYNHRNHLKVSQVSLIKVIFYTVGLLLVMFLPILLYKGFVFEFHLFERFSDDSFLFYFLMAFTVVPLSEELIYKTYALEFLADKKHNIATIVIVTSVVFGLFHLPGLDKFIYSTIFSILLCLIYLKERNILYPIIIHSLFNIFVFTFYHF